MKSVILIRYILVFILFTSCNRVLVSSSFKSNNYDNFQNLVDDFSNKNNNVIINYVTNFSLGSTKNLNGKIKFLNDQIYINGVVKNIGIEAFRMLIENDSIIFLDRINKRFYIGSTYNFSALKDYSFLISNLSNFLKGTVFSSGSDCEIVHISDGLYSLVNNNESVISVNYYDNGLLNKVKSTNDSIFVKLDYMNFYTHRLLPKQIDFNFNNRYKGSINYSNIISNKEDYYRLIIPKNYISL